ncbi:MAG: hypothetical protein ACK4QL_10860 [Pseudanabaenaceae cyanobacterium]
MNTTKTVAENTSEATWQSLKQVISQSAGFRNWLSKQPYTSVDDLDKQITSYLRDTLQTLAY